jgi:phosphatidylserine synthase 2
LILIYLAGLIFILFQTTEDAREMMKFLYPDLGKKVTKDMHTYEENCDFKWENIYDNMDHYFAIHWINWFFAALIVRDYYILHFWSILDELIGKDKCIRLIIRTFLATYPSSLWRMLVGSRFP